jgi:uncharacterized protein (DUF169 family)
MKRDFTILERLAFDYKPVGLKFLLNKPAGLAKIDASMPICQMFREAQRRPPFYASAENFACVERLLLGFIEPEPTLESGQIGAKEHIYQDARANRRIYQYVPKLEKGTVRHVAFAPFDDMPFDPDVLVLTARPDQAEILLRALSYSTGKPITSILTPVLMCAWLFLYPYVEGKVNHTVTGLGYGMKAKKLFPEGLVLVSVPYDLIPMLLDNLAEMEWHLPIHTMTDEERGAFAAKVTAEIAEDYRQG